MFLFSEERFNVLNVFHFRCERKSNSLPQNVTDSSSVNCFKNALDKIRKITMGFFED